MTKDKEIPGLDNARGWYASIVEMVEALEKADFDAIKEGPTETGDYGDALQSIKQRIHESVLSVEVRSGWYLTGSRHTETGPSPEEYRILLSTGGPALQIVGTLSEHGEPETAALQSQDWGTPWTYLCANQTLLTFARCFYFGE